MGVLSVLVWLVQNSGHTFPRWINGKVAVDPDVWTFSAKGIMTQWAENDRTNGFNGYNGGFNTIKLELYIGFNTLMVFYG